MKLLLFVSEHKYSITPYVFLLFQMDSLWSPCGLPVVSLWSPVVSRGLSWSPVVSLWSPVVSRGLPDYVVYGLLQPGCHLCGEMLRQFLFVRCYRRASWCDVPRSTPGLDLQSCRVIAGALRFWWHRGRTRSRRSEFRSTQVASVPLICYRQEAEQCCVKSAKPFRKFIKSLRQRAQVFFKQLKCCCSRRAKSLRIYRRCCRAFFARLGCIMLVNGL